MLTFSRAFIRNLNNRRRRQEERFVLPGRKKRSRNVLIRAYAMLILTRFHRNNNATRQEERFFLPGIEQMDIWVGHTATSPYADVSSP